jgi:uncharacterized protein HemX
MSATLSPTQLFLADELSAEPSSEEALYIHQADLENGQGQPPPDKRTWLTVVHFLIAAGIGLVAALAWQSHGDAAKETIAPVREISPDLETMRQSIDALTTSTATNQAHMMRSIDQLAASQEQITREIAKLQEIEQNVLSKNSDHPLQPAPKPVRPSQAPTVLTHAKSP